MAIREKLRLNAYHLLQPGETVQEIFCGQTASPYWSIVSYWIVFFKNAARVVVVTDRRILVCRAGRTRATAVDTVVAEFPRHTRIGPPQGVWYKCEKLGERLYIHRRFHKDVAAADRALARD
jgi:hypothetical protein